MTVASSPTSSLLPLEQCVSSVRQVGSKVVQLRTLARRGATLPETWVLETSAFREVVQIALPPGHDPHALLRLGSAAERIERAARARERLLAASLPRELDEALVWLAEQLLPRAPWGLAVRSSPSCEDDSIAFMAGLSSASLGVRSANELIDALKALWASVYLPRTLEYLMRRRVKHLAVAVVIQPVVRADVSGVLSTRAPPSAVSATWRTGERLINATLGLGPVVKGGDAVVDVLRITKQGELVSALLADKRARLSLEHGELEEIPVPEHEATSPSLSPEQLARLAALASMIELCEPPQFVREPEGEEGAEQDEPAVEAYDISFAFEGERLYVLQGQQPPSKGYPQGGDEHTVWSRATVTESLTGVVSPLTWSMSEPFVDASFRRAFQRLGASAPRDQHLVANVHGRAYLNLSALMRFAAQLPGIKPAFVGQLAGVEGLELLAQQAGGVSRKAFYGRLPLTVARQLSDQAGLTSLAAEFDAFASEARRALAEIDLAILPDDALVPTLRESRAVLGRAVATLATATTAYVTSHIALRTALERTFPVEADRLAQLVTSGVPTLESTSVAVSLGRVAEIARDEQGARELLLSGALDRPELLPAGPTRRALLRFLDEHGDHSQQAAELMLPRWGERPAPVLAMLRAMLGGMRRDGARALSEVRARADRERAALERKIPLVDRLLVRALVDRTRQLCEVREQIRGWLMKSLAMARRVALEVDRRLLRVSPQLGRDAVFYCTFDELIAGLSTGRPEVEHLVGLRRAERRRDVAQPDPPTTFVGAPPPVVLPPPGDAVLRGVAVSSGAAVGRARVVHDLEREGWQLEPGEVLVVKTADIGFSPLFLVASALVTQQGGRLTQGSVLARELGLPAVVHVSGATRIIRTGDLLRVDGDEGVVERLASTRDTRD